MKLSEIKKLSRKEFVARYPFLQIREWDRDTLKWKLAFYEEADPDRNIEVGDPYLEFYIDDWHGWSDILLCWAEKVKPYFDKMPKEVQDKFYISELKEKYGDMRLYIGIPDGFEKISEYTYMVEHLSRYTCLRCGKITTSSDNKKLLTWRTRGYWISYDCKKCAREYMFQDIQSYGRKSGWTNKMIFDQERKREEGDWFCRIIGYGESSKIEYKYDCRELLEGMY